MDIALLAITDKGWKTAEKIACALPGADLKHYSSGIRAALERAWFEYDAIVCIMASGIVVRCIAGLCSSKFTDPCIIVVDENGRHVISLLSGHVGGGNQLARQIAAVSGGTAVVTTASDVSGHTAVDLWSIEQNCTVANPEKLAGTAAQLLRAGSLRVFQDRPFVKILPEDFQLHENAADADIVISLSNRYLHDGLHLIPRIRHIGFGCRRGVGIEEFKQVLAELESTHGVDLRSVAGLASIDIKRDEAGLIELQHHYNWPIRFFTKEEINEIKVPGESDVVFARVGVRSVSEATALLAASGKNRDGRLIVEKIKWQRITAAVAETAY